ncbi:MAG: YdcF family protein [Acidobacteria bacterium]|nr:YdcF family protein [Acidobacteriota bacterium]
MHRRFPSSPPERGGVAITLLVLLLLVLVLGTVYWTRAPLLRALGEWWVVDERLEPAQALVVLGGDSIQGDRLRHAVSLYRQGLAPRLVLSGPPLRTYLDEAELMKREALEQGVPADHLIVARHPADSTLAEALALRPVLAEHNFRKIIVVTSNFHTRRARWIFLAVYRPLGTQVLVSAAPDFRFAPARWWQERAGRAALAIEVLKTLYTLWEVSSLLPPPATPQGICLPGGTAL